MSLFSELDAPKLPPLSDTNSTLKFKHLNTKNMRTFKSIKLENSNTIIPELNAKVLTSTFKIKEGSQLADVYTYEGTQCKCPMEIVAHNTCAPILGKYIETITVEF
jgi:hypothetical protein